MEETSHFAIWSQTSTVLLQHFKDSTIELVWENGNSLTYSVLNRCILLQCILLNFKTAGDFIPDVAGVKIGHAFSRYDGVYDSILWANARASMRLKFTSGDLLLVPGGMFPSLYWGNQASTGVSATTQLLPIQFPATILFEITDLPKNIYSSMDLLIVSDFSEALLIFVNLNHNKIKIACFSCATQMVPTKSEFQYTWYRIKLVAVPQNFASKFETLLHCGKFLQSNLQLTNRDDNEEPNYLSHEKQMTKTVFSDETAQIYKAYFKNSNCSNFEKCLKFYKGPVALDLKVPFQTSYLTKIYAVVTHHIEYTFQVVFPKRHILDANLMAFLMPFDLCVWLSICLAIILLSTCLIMVEGADCVEVLFWQYAVLFEQNDKLPFSCRQNRKALILLWVGSTVFIREFYSSSLYSLMTVEREPHNFPKTMKELLNRTDFELLSPKSFNEEVKVVFYQEYYSLLRKFYNNGPINGSDLNSRVVQNYLNILYKSKFLNGTFDTKTLSDVIRGKLMNVYRYVRKLSRTSYVWSELERIPVKYEDRKFVKFAIICKGSCEKQWHLAAAVQKYFTRIVSKKQTPFFIKYQFWIQDRPSFATFKFGAFLASFVESGLYSRTIRQEDRVYDSILWANARALKNLKFVSGEILFVPGIIFPTKYWRAGGPTAVNIMAGFLAIRFPTAILFETSNQYFNGSSPSDHRIVTDFSEALTIFVNLDKDTVKVSCFSCALQGNYDKKYYGIPWYSLDFVAVPQIYASNFKNLLKYWKNIQSSLQFVIHDNSNDEPKEEENSEYYENQSISKIFNEIYKEYFKKTNCSNSEKCLKFYKFKVSLHLRLVYQGSYLMRLHSGATHQIEYTFQAVFPNVHILDTNLNAFLTPFELSVWICLGVAIFAISIWLIFAEKEGWNKVLLWQYAVIFEQNDKHPFKCELKIKILVLTWVGAAFVLRQFYISTLYSLMTKEKELNDFPKTMQELLNQTVFDLLASQEFVTDLKSALYHDFYISLINLYNDRPENSSMINSGLTQRYLRIFYKSYYLNSSIISHTDVTHIHQNAITFYKYVQRPYRKLTAYVEMEVAKKIYEDRKFIRFAMICKAGCESQYGDAISHSKDFRRIIPRQQKAFLIVNHFWVQDRPSFATLRFSEFLASFVNSGLYGRIIEQHRLSSIQAANNFSHAGLRNPYGKEQNGGFQRPTKISSLIGTLIVMFCMLVVAFLMLVVEIIMHL
ncbi:unnamed protein product [Orchesella dallaii]|uniref:Uncharacterized protein n=1 Tax=Orchesella dallaii TaxID=48710 RepID=A0ABP1PIG0_9HEXA